MSDDSRLLTQEEAGIILRASTRKLKVLRDTGIGPPFLRVGRNILYPQDGLAKWLKDSVVATEWTDEDYRVLYGKESV